MTLSIHEHPEAREELREAAFWYDDQQLYLGDDFYDAIEVTIERVLEYPQAASVFPGWDEVPVVRNASVTMFPYRVIYYHTDTKVVIIAYAHEKRRPGYWRQRL